MATGGVERNREVAKLLKDMDRREVDHILDAAGDSLCAVKPKDCGYIVAVFDGNGYRGMVSNMSKGQLSEMLKEAAGRIDQLIAESN